MGEEKSGKKHLGPLLAIGAIATAGGIGLGLLINWFPTAASEEAGPIDTLWDVLLIVSVPIFVLTQTIVLYSVWRFRMRPGEELKDGPPIHGNTRLEVIWTAIPAIILVALCSYAYVVLRDIETADASEMKVRVVGEQFTWTFFYPADGGKEIASNQLYLPKDKQVRFDVQSKDVLHDFWVPAFRQKIDAVPGITTHYRIKPTKTGTFPVVCAELCGLGHSVMRQSAHVVSQGDFDAWLDEKQQAGAGGGGGGGEEAAEGGGGGAAAPDGKALFTTGSEPACGSCHTLADAGTSSSIGPNLSEVLKGKDAAFIQQSIEEPGAEVTNGFQDGIMPTNYGDTLQPEEIKALTDYLVEVATK
ncbi:MAG TPA: cytochrome c oxidase subunit II [Solirubrobacteraceae bacterium]|nr:cytochrome c oxidase subunit II [Solirubrobacteraceae bacterium]